MKDAPSSGDFDMILQNAEGEKSKSTSTIRCSKQCHFELESFADAINK
jgi:hypothetical protein